jgi:hypothetical protein
VRKSTVVALVIVVAAGVGLAWLLDVYVGYAETALRNGRDLTDAYREALAPGSRVRLRRVAGGERYPVKAPERAGLLVEASPSGERWARDPSAVGLSRDLAERAFALYAADDPISWVLLRMRRPDGTLALHAFVRGDSGHLEAIPAAGAAPVPGAGTPSPPPSPPRPR